MRTVVLQRPGELAWREVDEPIAAPGEARVQVLRCGVCGTDTHALVGRQPFFSYPRRLGHELCVRVLSVAPNDRVAPGDLCAVEPYYFCGRCRACRIGRTNCCSELKVLGVHVDGGHAPRLAVPIDKLHRSSRLSADELAMIEPLAIGAHGVERAGTSRSDCVAVIGLGPIGLAALLAARAAGANCVGVDLQPARVEFARRMGFATLSSAGNLVDELRRSFGQRPDVVFDATGNADSMRASFDLPEHGGRLVFLGLFAGSVSFDDPSFHRRELTLLASRAALSSTFADVIRLVEEKAIDARSLVTHRLPFDALVDRLPTLSREDGIVKAIIDFHEHA